MTNLQIILATLAGGGVVAAAASKSSTRSATIGATLKVPPPKMATLQAELAPAPVVGDSASKSSKSEPSGPLPEQALDALAGGRSKTRNNLHNTEAWFYFGAWSKGWFRKLDKMRWYSSPTGAIYLKSKDRAFNLAWMARAPDRLYPKYGSRDRSVRMRELSFVLGPKADLKSLGGWVKDIAKNVPAMLKAIGVGAKAYASGGASLAKDTDKQLGQVTDAIKGQVAAYSGAIDSAKGRTAIADAIVGGAGSDYKRQLIEANPHLINPKTGKMDIGKRFMKNPQTFADLHRSGKSYPLIFNPAKG